MVYESAKGRIAGLSRTTVYRVLETLVELGVVRRLGHPGPITRFDAKTSRHHHLVCRICNRVIDFESRALSELRLPPLRQRGFLVEDYSVHIVGVCKECGKKKTKGGRDDRSGESRQ